ncbi:MAG: nucleotidyltransferase, partial [Actinobacteria bacterium]|nr:nucleotidyltransferase [Actinomycetota bacterium]
MKLIRHFDYFLTNTVNLDQTRLDRLKESSDAVYEALKNDKRFGPLIHGMIRQGSWAHRTIIGPLPGHEFDADFLLKLAEVPDWAGRPKTYIEELGEALARIKPYTGMPRENKCRCVRLGYKGNFHLDIVPYVILGDGSEFIVNADEDEWERTNPTGFTQWMKDKDDIAGGNLRRVIRIMKFLRDHKGTFEGTKSIILTTILGNQVQR